MNISLNYWWYLVLLGSVLKTLRLTWNLLTAIFVSRSFLYCAWLYFESSVKGSLSFSQQCLGPFLVKVLGSVGASSGPGTNTVGSSWPIGSSAGTLMSHARQRLECFCRDGFEHKLYLEEKQNELGL